MSDCCGVCSNPDRRRACVRPIRSQDYLGQVLGSSDNRAPGRDDSAFTVRRVHVDLDGEAFRRKQHAPSGPTPGRLLYQESVKLKLPDIRRLRDVPLVSVFEDVAGLVVDHGVVTQKIWPLYKATASGSEPPLIAIGWDAVAPRS